MQTLHEFMLVTKGHEYLIAIAFLVVFVLFWQFLFRSRVMPAAVRAFSMESFRIPGEALFHPGHAWAFLQPGGSVRVGIDDFIRTLTGPIDEILTPEPGARTRQGEPMLKMKVGAHVLEVPSPLSGKVKSINENLLAGTAVASRSPLEQEWLVEIVPANPEVETSRLKMADQAASWLKGEMERLREFLSNQGVRPVLAGVTLADGGEPITGALPLLDEKGWKDFQREFVTTDTEA